MVYGFKTLVKYLHCIFFLSLLSYPDFASGQEEILSYDVSIKTFPEDKIQITEKIRVRAEGNLIQRGIYRSIPNMRPNKQGKPEPAPVRFLEVRKNNRSEDYHTQKSDGYITLYIGDKDRLLDPGVYEYEIRYETHNQIGFFEDYDELYWNVTGHDWYFPILQYSVEVQWPDSASFVRGACYTGHLRSTLSHCTLEERADENTVVIKGTKPLNPGEGITIAVAWSKGHVNDNFYRRDELFSSGTPSDQTAGSEDGAKFILNYVNLGIFALGSFLFFILGYGWWKKVGVDPPKHTTVPSWEPPSGFSPAAIHYLKKHTITDTTVSSALVNAAVKGAIKIENKRKEFTFKRLSHDPPLEPEEKALIDRLFASKKQFKLDKKNLFRLPIRQNGLFFRTSQKN